MLADPAQHTPAPTTRRALAVTILAMLLTAYGALTTSAFGAAGDAEWSVRTADNEHGTARPNYSYQLDPGDRLTDAIVVNNRGDIALDLRIDVADGFTTSTGLLDLYTSDVPPVDLGAWVVPETREITLEPGQTTELPFTLAVPEDAAPGDHTGGIVTVMVSDVDGTLVQERRLGTRIHVRVSGEQTIDLRVSDVQVSHGAGLNPFAPTPATITYSVTNDGNVRTVFTEAIAVSGPGGVARAAVTELVDEIVPGSTVQRSVEVQAWPLLHTSAEVTITPEAVDGAVGEALHAESSTWAVPWSQLALLLVVVGVGVGIGVIRSRRGPDPAAV